MGRGKRHSPEQIVNVPRQIEVEKWKATMLPTFPTAAASHLTHLPPYTDNLAGTSYRAGHSRTSIKPELSQNGCGGFVPSCASAVNHGSQSRKSREELASLEACR